MAIRKNQRVASKSELAFKDEEAEITAVEEWLHIIDKPLSRKMKDEISDEPSTQQTSRV